MSCTIKVFRVSAASLAPERYKREKISVPADGGGKIKVKKNAVCTLLNLNKTTVKPKFINLNFIIFREWTI